MPRTTSTTPSRRRWTPPAVREPTSLSISWARQKRPPRLVVCSSLAAAGPARIGKPRTEDEQPAPVSMYGRSKLAAEQAAREFADRVPTVIVHGTEDRSVPLSLSERYAQRALEKGDRVLLLITGKPRPSDDYAARGHRRGAIRAKVLDWLAAGPHASRIAAVRPAHPRHGGAGALYIVLRRPR